MSGKDRSAYFKAYRAANKDKARAYYINNKEKIDAYNKSWRGENKDGKKAYDKAYNEENKEYRMGNNKALRESEGMGVYKVVYPSGIYIGSGWIYTRRSSHLNGAECLKETGRDKALSFEIISLTNTVEEARLKESEVIEQYGLDNLINING